MQEFFIYTFKNGGISMKKTLSLVITLIMFVSILFGCSNNVNTKEAITNDVKVTSKTVTFTDARNKSVTINKKPKRVVCLYNSYLDLWYKCGGEVIGRVDEAKEKQVEQAKNAASVGAPGNPSLEMILSLKPDLVILSSGFKVQMALVETLEQNNIQVIALKSELKDEYYKMVRIFTGLTQREDLYKKNGYEVKAKIDEITAKVPKDSNPKVLLLFATAKGITTKNSHSMVGEMLKDLGTTNIADGGNSSDSNIFSMEKVLQEDPDFIFVQTMGSDIKSITDRLKKDVESNPAWASLKAVKNNNYIFLDKKLYLYRPNDKYAEAYEGLAQKLYPEIFK